MKDYEINDETLAIMPGEDLWDSVVVEDDCNYEVNMKPLEILIIVVNILVVPMKVGKEELGEY